MAERRMFAKSVINSARFLRMPQTARLLYYDLGMSADDDGIVEAFTVMRTTGAAEDDLSILAVKGFVKILNEDLVTYINDWHTNNQIRKDRYNQSQYASLLIELSNGNQRLTDGLPNGNQRLTQDSIVKDSIVKGSIEEISKGKGIVKGETKPAPRNIPQETVFNNEAEKTVAEGYRKQWLTARETGNTSAMIQAKIELERFCNVTIDAEGNYRAR